MTTGQLATIEAWHAAVNAGDAGWAAALCTDDVEVDGPRGSGHGRDLVVDWMRHAGIRLDPVRWYCGAAGAVVEQDARRPDAGTGELPAPTRLATAFGIRDGRVTRVLRYPELADALAELGLGSADEVTSREIGR